MKLHLPTIVWVALGAVSAPAQEVFNWEAAAHFSYAIHDAVVGTDAVGRRSVTVQFSVVDPLNGNHPWDLKNAPEFKQPAGASRLAVAVGWTTQDYQNTGAVSETLAPVPFKVVGGVASGGGAGIAPALPVSVDVLKNAVPVGPTHPGWYQVSATLPAQAAKSGVVALEGHPAWATTQADGSVVWERVPVKSVHRYIAITDAVANPRRAVVDIAKCKQCHDDKVHGDTVVPRLALHGANRVENLEVCVICHNPNQTDIGYRTSGDETPVDFKYMVHAIHAGERRHDPLTIIGFRGSTNDFSAVRFPGVLSDCVTCHVDNGSKGTFELPVASTVVGSTLVSGSVPGSFVDVDPANDRKMSPTVSACAACHDDNETLAHMMSRKTGGSFNALPADLASGRVRERCVECHGAGKEKDIRHVHEIRASRQASGMVGSGQTSGVKEEDDDDNGKKPEKTEKREKESRSGRRG